MILGVDGWVLAAIAGGLFLGATLQGVVGIGLNLVAAPVVAIVAPALVPAVPLVWAVLYPLATLWREWRDADWRGLGWAVGGRVPGTAVGVLIVASFSDRLLGVATALMVLVAVLLTWRAVRLPVTRTSLGSAGFIGGVTGTATSIGGPPVALVYQHHSGPQIRASMAAFFVLGGLISIVGLAVGGQMSRHDLSVSLLLTPVLVVAHLVSGPLRGTLDRGYTRVAVLLICGASALGLLVRSLLG